MYIAQRGIEAFTLRIQSGGIGRCVCHLGTFGLDFSKLLCDFLAPLAGVNEKLVAAYLLLPKKMLAPYIGVENRLESWSVITSDLCIVRVDHHATSTGSYLLLYMQNGDVRGDVDLATSESSKQS